MAGEDPLATLEDPRIGVGLAALENPETQEDFRESAEFESLESEFRKMETGGPNAVRWKQLNDDTVKVLQSSSKDLVLATRLAFGLFVEEGYRGLAVGLVILRDMTGAHWETMIPPVRRERGRAGAFDWLAEKLAPMVEAKKPDGKANAEVHVAHEALLELDNSLEQKMTKSQVALGPLVRALRPYARDAKATLEEVRKAAEAAAAAAAPPPPAEEASAQADQAAADGSAQSAAVETPQPAAAAPAAATPAPPAPAPVTSVAPIEVDTSNASAAIQSVFNAATKAASTLRREALTDARGYHAARFALWGTVEGPPPHQNGKTALPPPQKNKIAEIAALKSAGNTEGLINSAESAFVTSPFWLDTQFFLAEAMTGAGPAYEAARLLVVSELSAFLRRVPDIAGLTFSDGTAFASMETREWVAREVQAGGGGGSVPSGSDLDKAFSAAVQQALAGKPADGLTVLKNHVSGCGAGRDWFKAQLKIGEFCLRFDLVHPLFALLGSLRAIAVERDLAHWEPELAIALARLSWQSLGHKNAKQMLPDADALKLRANLMETLSLLDVAEAAELAGRK
ncbi:type VI secretion system protein TssA [Roseibium marinum]|uniref:Type VI secretion system protein VasJ n=1 Tax=Roseibium marinum TaxID=281252 RepID=A0A2S3V288_9HYPH|nr:type VI secretion system protein TssA [Roseibium marinum]POF33799.1 type VI secretion system protein VasJ [Roseibium marinum]